MSSALWWVLNGRAAAPPGIDVHHRRLDFEEAAGVEEVADPPDQGGAHLEDLARLFVGGEVEIALAVARLDVGQAVPLLRHRAQRLGEEGQVVDHQGQLAGAGADQRTGGADDVAEVEVVEHQGGLLGQPVLAHEELDLVAAVVQVGEDQLALAADGAHTPGHPQPEAGGLQLFGGLLPVLLFDGGRLEVPGKAVRVDRDARLRQRLPLVTPVLDLFVELGHGSLSRLPAKAER